MANEMSAETAALEAPYVATYNGRCDHCRTLHTLNVEGVGEPTAQTTTMPCCACHRGRVEVWLRALERWTGATDALLRGHGPGCKCEPCVDLRQGLADIAEAERIAWERSKGVYIR